MVDPSHFARRTAEWEMIIWGCGGVGGMRCESSDIHFDVLLVAEYFSIRGSLRLAISNIFLLVIVIIPISYDGLVLVDVQLSAQLLRLATL